MEVIDLTETDSTQIIKENVASTSTKRTPVKAPTKLLKKKRNTTMTLKNNTLIDLTKENYVDSSDEEASTSNIVNTMTKEQELAWLSGAIARAREMRFVKFLDPQNAPEPSHVYNLDCISSSEDDMIEEEEDILVIEESSNQIENDTTVLEIEENSTKSVSLNECAKPINDESLAAHTSSLATEIEENASTSTLSQLINKDNSSSAIQVDQNISETTSLPKHDELLNLNSTENSSPLQETAESSLLLESTEESTEEYDFNSHSNDSQTKESAESESSSMSKYIKLHDPDSPANYSQDETDEEASNCSTLTRFLKSIDTDDQCTKDNDKEISSTENPDCQAKQPEDEILDLSTARSAESLEVSQPVTKKTFNSQENTLVYANTAIEANERIKDCAVDGAISKELMVDSPRDTDLRKGIRRKTLDNAQIELTNNSTNFIDTMTQTCQAQVSAVARAEISESVFSNEPEAIDFSMKTYALVNNIETPSESSSNKPENQIPSANPLVDNPALKNRIWNPAQSDAKSSSNTAIQEDETGLNVSPIISEGMISTDTENLVYEIENEVTLLPLKKRKRHSTISNQASDDFAPSNIDSHSEDSYSESLQLYTRKVNHKNTDDVAYSPTPRFSIANFHDFGNNDTNIGKTSYSDPPVEPIHYNMSTCLEKPPSAENHQLLDPEDHQTQLSEKHQLSHQQNRQLHQKRLQELLQLNQQLIHQEKPPLPQPENLQLAIQQKPPLPQPQNHQLEHQQKLPLPLPENQQDNPPLSHQDKLEKLKVRQTQRKRKTPQQLPDNHQPPQQEERQLQQHQLSHQENLQLLDLQRQELMRREQFWLQFWANHPPPQVLLEQYLRQQNQNSHFSQQQLTATANSQVIHEIEVMRNRRYKTFRPYRQVQPIPPQSEMPYLPFYPELFRRHRNQTENIIPTQLVDDATHRQRILRPATQPTQMATPSILPFQRSAVPELETASESTRPYETIPSRIFNQFGR